MKVLFVIFHGFDPNNGISKKISYQLDAFRSLGYEAHICYMDEHGTKKRIVDQTVVADYGNGILSKIKKRVEFSSISDYAINNKIDFVYIRSNHNANLFTINMVKKMKKKGTKVVMEIPTYPYDSEYKAQGISRQIFQDKIFRSRMASYLDAIVTFSDYKEIFGQRTIRISNGIDFDSVPNWQRYGCGIYFKEIEREGFNPIKNKKVIAKRRELFVDYEIPYGVEYKDYVLEFLEDDV